MKHFFRRGGKNAAEAAQQNVVAVESATLNTSAAIKPKRFKHVKLFCFLFLVLIIGAGVAYLLISGKAYVGLKEPGQKVTLRSTVCSGSDIDDTFIKILREKGMSRDQYTGIVEKIKSQAGYEYDPDCLYIIAYDAASSNYKDTLVDATNRLDQMDKEGINLSNKLNNFYTYSGLERFRSLVYDKK